ncbi:glycoside hydrolase family 43 protein [Mucilaginibacter sp. HD30]
MKKSGNPIITNLYTADPTVLAFEDTVYLYTGHDEAPVGTENYFMRDWLCFSSREMVTWQDHGSLLKATDFSWAKGDAYASCVVKHNDKFYWFVAVTHAHLPGKAIGVAVASKPEGPFQDAKGSALITHNMLPPTDNEKANLDPSVLIDDDGKAYIFWGNGQCYFAQLDETLQGLTGTIITLDLPGFQEGAHIHKNNGWYYLCYGQGMPEKVSYARSRKIEGPWDYMGILNEIAGNCETNRPAIVRFKGKSYFFYHNGALQNGGSHRRSVCVDDLFYNSDGTLKRIVMTSEGVDAIEPVG